MVTIARDVQNGASTYVLVRADGSQVSDRIARDGVLRFGNYWAASSYCTYFGIDWQWEPEDWPGFMREAV